MKTSISTLSDRAVVAGLIIVLAFAAAAWACTQSAYLEAANPKQGPAGSGTTLEFGGGFAML